METLRCASIKRDKAARALTQRVNFIVHYRAPDLSLSSNGKFNVIKCYLLLSADNLKTTLKLFQMEQQIRCSRLPDRYGEGYRRESCERRSFRKEDVSLSAEWFSK